MKIITKDFYAEAIKDPENRLFVEVGSKEGASVAYLTKILQDRDAEFTVFSVDQWSKNERSAYNLVLTLARVRKDVFDMICSSETAASKFKDGSIDVCLLNEDQDPIYWFNKIKDNGILAMINGETVVRIK